MASYFGMDISGSTDMDTLVNAYFDTRQGDLDAITAEKTEYQTSLSFWSTIQTDVNKVASALDPFDIDGVEEDFITRTTSSSDDSVVTVSSAGGASIGTTLVKVDKLAEKDLLLSGRLNLEEQFGETGTKVFTLDVGDKSFDISIEFTGEETNGEALQMISDAINDTEDITINAAYVKDTPSTGILSLMADDTGDNNTITISGSDMLSKLGLDNLDNEDGTRKTYQQGESGYRYTDSTTLNARFNVNGIDIIRNENTVDDVIEGMTITLKKAQDSDEQAIYLETDIDVEAVKELLQPILDAYNKIVTDLYVNKTERRNNSSLANLYSQLRDIPSSKISSVTDNSLEYLMSIGMDISDYGEISFSDDELLYDVLKEYPEKLGELFISDGGFNSKIQEIVENYHGEDNLVSTMKSQLNDQIDRADKRYASKQSSINKAAQNLEKQYTNYLSSYYEAQNQQNYLQTMPTNASSANSSLLQSYYS